MKTKKLISLLLALVLVFGIMATAEAVDTEAGGPGKIEIENAELGETYAIYKLFDATVSEDGTKIAYRLPEGKTIGSPANAWFTVDAVGNVSATNALNASALQSDEFKHWAQSFNRPAVAELVATENNLVDGVLIFENVPYGYYFVSSSLGAKVTVDSTNPTARIIDKNTKPDWDNGPENPGKIIVKGNNVTTTVNTAKLEEDIQFDIGITAKNYDGEDKIFKYEILDTMYEGMTFTSGLTVKVGSVTIAPEVKWFKDHEMTQGTELYEEAQAFKITIPWTSPADATGKSLYANGSEIHVEYTAKLDSEKLKDTDVTNDVLVNAANENKSTFKWYAGNDTIPNPTDPKGTSPERKTETYVTQLEISKIDGKTKTKLEGAEFTLTGPDGLVVVTKGTRFVEDNAGTYWKLKDGTYTTTDPNGQNINKNAYESTTKKYKLESFSEVQGANQTTATMKAFVDSNGKATFTHLTVGQYKLEETVVPSGYNKAPILEFVVSFDEESKTWTVTDKDGKETPVQVDENTGKLTLTIENNQGFEMPATGGMGTKLFYVIGAVLLLGAGILLVARRRMRTSEN